MKEERMGTCLGQVKEEFKDTKGEIRICISKRDRQHNCEKKKDKRTNNDLQNTTKNKEDRATRTTLKSMAISDTYIP
jgi:hypothetical protein